MSLPLGDGFSFRAAFLKGDHLPLGLLVNPQWISLPDRQTGFTIRVFIDVRHGVGTMILYPRYMYEFNLESRQPLRPTDLAWSGMRLLHKHFEGLMICYNPNLRKSK
jgi:hypothetical protein